MVVSTYIGLPTSPDFKNTWDLGLMISQRISQQKEKQESKALAHLMMRALAAPQGDLSQAEYNEMVDRWEKLTGARWPR